MNDPVVVAPAGGEIIGDAADRRVEILSDHDALHATWSRFAPGRDGADLHVHRRHMDLFYVLEGELTLRLGAAGDELRVPAGTLARMPPGVVHGFRNGAGAEVRYLNLHAPGVGFAGYMRSIRDGQPIGYDQFDPPADGGPPAADAVIGEDPVEAVLAPGVRARLLTGVEQIAVAELQVDAGVGSSVASGALHVHHDHVESFYVLEGELALVAGGRELRAVQGAWVQIPAGVSHSGPLAGATPLRLLDVHTPAAGFGDFVRALRETGDEREALARSAFDQHPATR